MNEITYVSIVKAKANDIAALTQLDASTRQIVRPLLELAEYEATDNDATLSKFIKHITPLRFPHLPYVDLYSFMPDAIVADSTNATLAGFQRIAAAGLKVIPTYGFGRNDSIWQGLAASAKEMNSGLCFRVDIDDLDDNSEQTWEELLERTAQMGLGPEELDIIVDLRFVGDKPLTQIISLITGFLALQPTGFYPKNITIAGSSALKTVTEVPVNGHLALHRQELTLWSRLQDLLDFDRPVLFGDYGIVHPDFSQSVRSPNSNAKIRYTRGQSIHYFRGSPLYKPVSNFSQYHTLAARVTTSEIYRGPQYSAGDLHILRCAQHTTGPGNLGTWVRVDQNHHIETTAKQMRHVRQALALGASPQLLAEELQDA